MSNSRFGERVRKARLRKGWSQIRLAEGMGVTQAYVSQLERGNLKPSPRIIDKLIKSLRVSRTYLIGMSSGKFEQQALIKIINSLSPQSALKLKAVAEVMLLAERIRKGQK